MHTILIFIAHMWAATWDAYAHARMFRAGVRALVFAWYPGSRTRKRHTSVCAVSLTRHLQALSHVGTPAEVRYSLPQRDSRQLWWPQEVAVRVNGGRWFSSNNVDNTTLCAVDANCREPTGCVGGRDGYGVLVEPIASNVTANATGLLVTGKVVANCSVVYRTSPPVVVSPLPLGTVRN